MFVSLEVELNDEADPSAEAENIFDWACMIGAPGIFSIDSYDYTLSKEDE